MKHLRRSIFCLAGLTAIVVPSAFAQVQSSNVSVSSDVIIVQSTAIYKAADLRFGAIVPGTSGGTVVMSTSGVRSKTGTVILPGTLSFGAASFAVLGSPSTTYSLTLPTSVTLGRSGGSETMTLNNFVSSPSTGGTLSSGGSATVAVGGTLNVGPNQTFGQYNGTFSVTVSFP